MSPSTLNKPKGYDETSSAVQSDDDISNKENVGSICLKIKYQKI